jgi:hypothetical protein
MSASTMHRIRPAPSASGARTLPRQGAARAPRVPSVRLEPLHELVDNVCGCLAVLRAALPGDEVQLSGQEASAYQVAALALSETLAEAWDLSGQVQGPPATVGRVGQVLMYADSLSGCLDSALWHACVGREGTAGDCHVRAGDVARTCALIEEFLVEALALLGQPAQGEKGGAA